MESSDDGKLRKIYAAVWVRSACPRLGVLIFRAGPGEMESGEKASGSSARRSIGEASSAATARRNLPPVTLCSAATSDDWWISPILLTAVCVSVSQSCQLPTASCKRLSSAMKRSDFNRFWAEFCRVAGALDDDPVLMKQLFGHRARWPLDLAQHSPSDREWIAASFAFYLFCGSLQAPLDLTHDLLYSVTSAASSHASHEDRAGVRQPRLAPRFLRHFQAAQSRELHIQVTHFAGLPANPVQRLEQLLLVAAAPGDDFFQQRLQSSTRGAKAMHTSGILLGRKFRQSPFHFAERKLPQGQFVGIGLMRNNPVAFGRVRHKNVFSGQREDDYKFALTQITEPALTAANSKSGGRLLVPSTAEKLLQF